MGGIVLISILDRRKPKKIRIENLTTDDRTRKQRSYLEIKMTQTMGRTLLRPNKDMSAVRLLERVWEGEIQFSAYHSPSMLSVN